MQAEQWVFLVLEGFSLLGIVVFAISGAVLAADKNLDILGFILIATVTAIGGGTLRDLLLGIVPVNWVVNPLPIYLCLVTACLSYFAMPLLKQRDRWLLWTDAVGLAAFAVSGAQVALASGAPPVVATVMGVMTATFGGIMRDVLCAEVLTLMRPELYISCALLGSVCYVVLFVLGVAQDVVAICAFVAAFALRASAIVFHLILPRWGGDV